MLDFIISAIAFVLIFTVLIYVHELGHFWACRWAKIRVEEFGFGLPPRIWGKKIDKTLWSINWIPLGGFVRPYGEDSHDKKVIKNKESFPAASTFRRFVVLIAGVGMNFLFAFLFLTVLFSVGVHPLAVVSDDAGLSGKSLVFLTEKAAIEKGLIDKETAGIEIHEVLDDSPFKDVLKKGDKIKRIDGNKILLLSQFISRKENGGRVLDLEILRGEEVIQEKITLPEDRKIGIKISGGIVNREKAFFRFPIYLAPLYAAKETVILTWENFRLFKKLFLNFKEAKKNVSGPVGIAKATDSIVKTRDFSNLVLFMVLLSISLGTVNILPFPALDGGRLVFIVYEVITRKKPNAKVERVVNAAGMAFLLILLAVVSFYDFFR